MNFIHKIILSLSMLTGVCYPGAILKMYRIDMADKTVFMFGERHSGHLDNQMRVADVGQLQQVPLTRFFADLEPIKDKTVLYLEASDLFCLYNNHYQTIFPNRNFGSEGPSFFDKFYTLYSHGNKNISPLSIENFDKRTKGDSIVVNQSLTFHNFLLEYKGSGYNQQVFDAAKQQVVMSQENHWLKTNFAFFVQESQLRYIALLNKLGNILPKQEFDKVEGYVYNLLAYFPLLEKLYHLAENQNQSIFEFLYNCAQRYQDDFDEAIKNMLDAPRLTNVMQLFDCVDIPADLNLLEKVLIQDKPYVFVHGGNAHIKSLISLLKTNEKVITTSSIDMIADARMIYDSDYCYNRICQLFAGFII